MSLDLVFGADPGDATAAAWRRELDQVLLAHGHPRHTEPVVPPQAWSYKRRAVPLADALDRAPGPWPVLQGVALDDAVFLPRPLAGVLVGPGGLTVAGLAALQSEVERLGAALASLAPDPAGRDARDTLAEAAARATAARCALWLR